MFMFSTFDGSHSCIFVHNVVYFLIHTVEPLFYDHPQNQIGVVVKEGWSSTRGLTIS